MAALVTGECRIVLVESLEEARESVLARLHTKRSVRLARLQPNRPEITQRLEDSLRRRVPIGLWLDQDDQVIEAGWAERDFLLNLVDQESKPDWSWVYFATGGSYPLRKSTPAFQRIEETIQYCRQTRSPAWLVTRRGSEGVELVDLQVLPPEEDALLCRLSNLGWV